MNEYTLTLTMDEPGSPSVIVLQQTDVDRLLNEFSLPAAVSAADNSNKRTVTMGTLEVSNDSAPLWNGEKIEQEVFANMLGDAIILAAIKYARTIIPESETPNENPGADN